MTSTASDAARARKNLGLFGSFIAFGAGASVVSRVTGFGMACPWRSITATPCPLCGSTHLGVSLLNGDLLGAWSANQFVFVGLIATSILAGFWVLAAVGGPVVRLPGRWGQRQTWVVTASIAALGFMIARNLWFPLP